MTSRAGREESRDFALRASATLDEAINGVLREMGGSGNIAQTYLKMIGFGATERFNRTVSAVAGKNYAEQLAGTLRKNPADKSASFQLSRLGLNPATIMERGLSEDDLLKAAQTVTRETQFSPRPQNLPLFLNSPSGKVLFQFKTFVYNQTKLIKNEILQNVKSDPAAASRKILMLVAAAPVVGELGLDAKMLVRNFVAGVLNNDVHVDRPSALVDRIIEDYAAVGSFGIFGDIYQSGKYGERGITNLIAGPTASNLMEAAVATGTGSTKRLETLAKRNTPVLGPLLSGPKKKQPPALY
ncbi:MAG TPA: hypothetical protein VGK99_03890 [Acidobacteriota bacterium]|jgi:hypothetical protein